MATIPSMQQTLDEAIHQQIRLGWRLVYRSETEASLVMPKRFSFLAFIVLLLLFALPGLIYVGWYMAKKDKTLLLRERPNGTVEYLYGR